MSEIIKDEKGQSTLELALVLPLLVALALSIVEFGWIFNNKLTLETQVRTVTRYFALSSDDYIGKDINLINSQARDKILGDTKLAASSIDVAVVGLDTEIDPSDENTEKFTLRVTYDIKNITPVGDIIGMLGATHADKGNYTRIVAECTMRKE